MKSITYSYIVIEPYEPPAVGERQEYVVRARRSRTVIASIAWYAAWGQYCFFPDEGTAWSAGCMADVQDFIARLAREAKETP